MVSQPQDVTVWVLLNAKIGNAPRPPRQVDQRITGPGKKGFGREPKYTSSAHTEVTWVSSQSGLCKVRGGSRDGTEVSWKRAWAMGPCLSEAMAFLGLNHCCATAFQRMEDIMHAISEEGEHRSSGMRPCSGVPGYKVSKTGTNLPFLRTSESDLFLPQSNALSLNYPNTCCTRLKNGLQISVT